MTQTERNYQIGPIWPTGIEVSTAWRPEGLETLLKGTSTQWMATDAEHSYRPEGNRYGRDGVGYHFNEFGYRCDDFTPEVPSDTPRILFAGCSNTMGIGVPLHHTYPSIVVEGLRFRYPKTPLWSVAQAGVSGDFIARVLYHAIGRLKPHVVWAMFPPGSRREWTVRNRMRPVLRGSEIPDGEQLLGEMYNEGQRWYEYTKNLILIDSVCRLHGAVLIWSLWDCCGEWRGNCMNMIASMPPELSAKWRDVADAVFDQTARDMMHPGEPWHRKIAEIAGREIEHALSGLGF